VVRAAARAGARRPRRALGAPGTRIFLNSAGDLELLPRILDAAEGFESRRDEAEPYALLTDLRLSTLFV
jgi:hypothetical protein